MKKICFFFIIFISVVSFRNSAAQSFETGYEFYQNEKYDSAAVVFSNIDQDRARLFAGKSYFANGDYLKALEYLNRAGASSVSAVRQEALFTLALTNFKIKYYSRSLELLFEIMQSDDRRGLRFEAQRMYNQILRFINSNQRFEAFARLSNTDIRKDLVEASERRMQPSQFSVLANQYLSTLSDSVEIQSFRERFSGRLNNFAVFGNGEVPEGMIYDIGVMLPLFENDTPEFTISRNLYFGLTLAAEEFNSRNADQKVFLNFKDTRSDSLSIATAFAELKWNHYPDAIVGPLFSEAASKAAFLAEQYQVPMLAPLANSDSLNLDYNYTFQLNPTFEVHGREMARYAVNQLKLDTLAVISESNALGTASALGFRYEAEKLGAHIAYYIEEDFASTGFDLRPYTEVFTPDSVLIDSLGYTPVDGIYAPFTGQAAPTLISLLLTDLEAMGTDVMLLGSAEWGTATLTDSQENSFEIWYTDAFGNDPDSLSLEQFIEGYELRFGSEPDQFSRIGYDAGNYLLSTLEESGNPANLGETLRKREIFDGLEYRIHFNGRRINQHVNIRHRGIFKKETEFSNQ